MGSAGPAGLAQQVPPAGWVAGEGVPRRQGGVGDAPGRAGVSQASPKLQHVPLGGDKVPLCHQ